MVSIILRSLLGAVLLICFTDPANAQRKTGIDADDEFVPAWAKEVVWYQIFPERFSNGDPSNDPTIDDIRGADPADPPKALAGSSLGQRLV